MTDGEWGVRYQETVGRNMSVVTRQKFFPTEDARARWADKIEQSERFVGFLAWSNPTPAAGSPDCPSCEGEPGARCARCFGE